MDVNKRNNNKLQLNWYKFIYKIVWIMMMMLLCRYSEINKYMIINDNNCESSSHWKCKWIDLASRESSD